MMRPGVTHCVTHRESNGVGSNGVGRTVGPSAALRLPQRAQLFFTELSPLNDQGILIKGMIRDRS